MPPCTRASTAGGWRSRVSRRPRAAAIRAALADFQQRIAGLAPTAEEQPDLELVCEPPLDLEPDLEPGPRAALAATEARHV